MRTTSEYRPDTIQNVREKKSERRKKKSELNVTEWAGHK